MNHNLASLIDGKIEAYFNNGNIVIHATGELSNSCYNAEIQKSMLDIEPPEFSLVKIKKQGVKCEPGRTQYKIIRFFPIGSYRNTICIHTASGKIQVPVSQVMQSQSAIVVEGGGGEVPVPFFTQLGAFSSKYESSHGLGYSANFAFDEAFHNAIASIPSDKNNYPDKLERFLVTEIGAEFGGFAGFNHLYVCAKRQPDPLAENMFLTNVRGIQPSLPGTKEAISEQLLQLVPNVIIFTGLVAEPGPDICNQPYDGILKSNLLAKSYRLKATTDSISKVIKNVVGKKTGVKIIGEIDKNVEESCDIVLVYAAIPWQ